MFNETYLEISNRFKSFLQASSIGTLLPDVAKDYLNRAQRWLQLETPWTGLVVDTPLTIIDFIATFPSDFISLVSLGHSIIDDGKINWYYYRDAAGYEGYTLIPVFSKDVGMVWKAKFSGSYPYSPNVCRYQKKLSDFTATGTEYSFFPGDLLFAVAKYLRIIDYNPNGADYKTHTVEIERLLKNCKKLQYQNNKIEWVTLGRDGMPVDYKTMNLTGSYSSYQSNYIPGRDC